MARDDMNVPPPPPPVPPMSEWKKDHDDAAARDEHEEQSQDRGSNKKKGKATEKSGSSVGARTRARTNGQKDDHAGKRTAAEIIGILDDASARHGHPQLERASVSHRWPRWAIDTVATKAQVEKRPAADIVADVFKRGFAGDPYAEHYYAEACERVNARENDWGLGEQDDG